MLQEKSPLKSLPLFWKLVKGDTDAIKPAQILREERILSKDMFVEIYRQNCLKPPVGELYGSNEMLELQKGLLSLTIVGLTESIPYVVKSLPETKVEVYCLKDEILAWIKILHYCGVLVRVIVSDIQFSNIWVLHKIVATADNSLYVTIDKKKEEH